MIIERYMVSGMPVGKEEKIAGCGFLDACGRAFIFPSSTGVGIYKNGSAMVDKVVEIAPNTIEPVKVRPIKIKEFFRCPNCNVAFILDFGITPFCGNCGQALDWSE